MSCLIFQLYCRQMWILFKQHLDWGIDLITSSVLLENIFRGYPGISTLVIFSRSQAFAPVAIQIISNESQLYPFFFLRVPDEDVDGYLDKFVIYLNFFPCIVIARSISPSFLSGTRTGVFLWFLDKSPLFSSFLICETFIILTS